MPGFTDDALTWRKRKRENEAPSFVPFRVEHANCDPYLAQIHNINHTHNHSHEQTPDKEVNFRPRCLPRKRRHVQPQPQHQQHQSYLLTPQPSLLSPNIYATTQDPYSPPVSPKSLVPIPYPTASSTTTSPSALRPCHICHRRPTTRGVLDAYADCDLCAERACFICLRLCDGSSCPGASEVSAENSYSGGGNGQADTDTDPYDDIGRSRRKICSSCAVEGISETGMEIVRCLDCVRPRAWDSWALDGDERMCG